MAVPPLYGPRPDNIVAWDNHFKFRVAMLRANGGLGLQGKFAVKPPYVD